MAIGTNPTIKRTAGVAALASFALAIAASSVIADPSMAWLVSLAALLAFSVLVGVAINNRPAGLIIDTNNRVSLSKLQALAWSLIVLSAFLTAAITRIRLGFDDPVAIVFPPELLAAMGISATSLVASPIILSLKSGQDAAPAQTAQTAAKLGESSTTLAPAGKVYARVDAKDARWLDLFRGDEVSNAATPDLSKLQQFLITVVVLIVYGSSIWKRLAGPEYITDETTGPSFFSSFPELSSTMVWLIGLSHAGYLAYKAAPHGPASAAPTASTIAAAAPVAADGAAG